MRIFTFLLFLGFTFLPFSKTVYARSIMEGFWAGVVAVSVDEVTSRKKGGNRVVTAELTVASDYGHLKIEPDLIDSLKDTACEYYFSHKEGKVSNIVLKPGIEGQICGDGPKIKFVRKDAETIFFSIQDSRMGLSETFPLELRHGLIPEGIKSVMPENFDIMDIELGMLRDAAEEQLAFRKYSLSKEGSVTYKGPGWRQRADVYIDAESQRKKIKSKGKHKPKKSKYNHGNKVYVMYSAVSQDQDDFSQEHVVFIARNAEVNRARGITFPAFSNSVSLKYGPKDSGDLVRYYNYDGVLKPNGKSMICEESNRQNVTVFFSRFKKFKGRTVVQPDCGSKAEIYAKTNIKTGLIESYEIILWNNDMLIENDWRKIAYQTIQNAELYLGRLSVDHVDIDL